LRKRYETCVAISSDSKCFSYVEKETFCSECSR
jgi:hypothetical protein